MSLLPRAILATTLAFASTAPSMAQGVAQGQLRIEQPWARETAPGQSNGGAFLTIVNKGKAADTLTGASTPVAREMQIHSMVMDGSIMRMRQMTQGLTIPAGGTVELKPGSYHIMFIGLNRPLKAGTKVPVTLEFQRAGRLKVEFSVQSLTGNPAPAIVHQHGSQ